MDLATLKKITLKDSLEKIVLFGLYSQIDCRELVLSVTSNGVEVSVYRVKSLQANVFLDLLYIGEIPAGSVFSVLVANNLVHVAGFYIAEEFRGYKLNYLDDSQLILAHLGGWKGGSAAKYLLSVFVGLTINSRKNICLEVKNYNEPACKLYEGFFLAVDGCEYRFEIANESQIKWYSTIRGKKIGAIYDFDASKDSTNKTIKVVRWKNVPLYNNTHIWSINRLYIMKTIDANEANKTNLLKWLGRRIDFAVRVAVYGDLMGYLKLKYFKYKNSDVS